jgi:hypothetical protein
MPTGTLGRRDGASPANPVSAVLRRRVIASLIAGLIGIGLLHGSAQARVPPSPQRIHIASASLRQCPYLIRELTAVSARGVSCKRADGVARAYVQGHHRPMGFRCRRIPVYQGGGETDWYGRCVRGKAVVRFVPE